MRKCNSPSSVDENSHNPDDEQQRNHHVPWSAVSPFVHANPMAVLAVMAALENCDQIPFAVSEIQSLMPVPFQTNIRRIVEPRVNAS